MASAEKRLKTNAAGDFFVDSSCIDCATCRWMAPKTFGVAGAYSMVVTQPRTKEEVHRALMAMVACPTASIGSHEKHDMARAIAAFPDLLEKTDAGAVYHVGYHAESSFGAAAYLIVRPKGNVLIDSPRFSMPLVRNIESLGGISTMFLTHKDDVADHDKWASHFGCQRLMHKADITTGTRGVERFIEGEQSILLGDGLVVIPTPGHTRGSMCLLFDQTVLFSGDHVSFSPSRQAVTAFHDACWFDWSAQRRSMERLLSYRFSMILPGHGHPCRFPADEMRQQLEACVKWMRERGA